MECDGGRYGAMARDNADTSNDPSMERWTYLWIGRLIMAPVDSAKMPNGVRDCAKRIVDRFFLGALISIAIVDGF